MPEGPLLILYRDELAQFVGQHLDEATTTLRSADLSSLEGCTLAGVGSWGKYLFLIFEKENSGAQHLRIHWGMFGIYTLDRERPGKEPKAVLTFGDRVLRLYSVSLRVFAGLPLPADYDPRADVMSAEWDSELAFQKLRSLPPATLVCDALMDQNIFAGLGNAIKTEALFAQRIHPEKSLARLPDDALRELLEEAIGQSQLFLEGKRAFGAERYGWTLAYRRKECPRCGEKILTGHTGVLGRKSHWCPRCQLKS